MQSAAAMDAGAKAQAVVPDEPGVRKGPWTTEEDHVLVNYIAAHGEGAWNSLARAAGLSRTGKSCRLRWLNYLRPDVRRGNMTAEEQERIVQLQARWGNKWSRIAKHLPGRTDNEVKNFWRTKIQPKQKHRNNNNNDCSGAAIESIVVADICSSMAAASRKTPAITEDDQGSSNYSGRTGVTQDYGIVTQQRSISSVADHHLAGNEIHGGGDGGAGAMEFIPEFLAASGENLWAIGDFWTTMQSYQGSS
ncbi:unnamed protein product [Urochloa decumbens]|uniref:Uncharacterized protein n=1 Tax=Urochloa decumbens TaxID=240449 RepID=A0ABC9GLR6_9POAL